MEETLKHVFEKLMDALLSFKNMAVEFGEQALAWLNQVFPPEKRAEWLHAAAPYLVIAAVVLVVALLAYKCCRRRGGGGLVKMMKAPGRNYSIPRSGFERNPRGYFRDLRGEKLLC